MAGDWIKMRSNLWDDPMVSRLCDLTNQSEATVIGGLYWLWAAADQHTEDGVMLGLSVSSINVVCGRARSLLDKGVLTVRGTAIDPQTRKAQELLGVPVYGQGALF